MNHPARSTRLLLAASTIAAVAMAFGPRLWGRSSPPRHLTPRCNAGGAAPARQAASFGAGTLSAALSAGKVQQTGPGDLFLSIDLGADRVAGGPRAPVDLAIVIDRSGSMAGEKLEAARQAARAIVARLGDGDRAALVQYDDRAELLAALAPLDAEARASIDRALAAMTPGGGTNLHAGMALGQEQLAADAGRERLARVVLLSDGQANQGIVDPATLARIAADAADRGVRTTTVGVGLDYNEDLMEALAESGRGRYHYVRDAASLEAVFADELRALETTAATAAALELEPACAGVEVETVFGHESRREGDRVIVPLADLYGGDRRRVVVKLRVPTGAAGHADLLRVRFRALDARTHRPAEAAVALGVEVSADAVAVQASVDREVMAHVLKTEGAAAVRAATEAFARGDRDGARALLGRKQEEMKRVARAYALPAEPVAAAVAALPALDRAMATTAPGSAKGKDLQKAAKAEARDHLQAAW